MDLPIIYHPDYVAPLPPGHRFPMSKFGQLYELLLKQGITSRQQVQVPEVPPLDWIEQVHTPEYVQAYCDGTLDPKAQRRIGLPWSAALARRTCTAVGGTILTAKLALAQGLACIALRRRNRTYIRARKNNKKHLCLPHTATTFAKKQ